MKLTPAILGLLALGATSQAALVWTVGDGDDANNRNVPEIANIYATSGTTTFVQETGTNPLPGDPNSPAVDQQADDDFYFPGVYNNVVDGGTYTPVGIVGSAEAGVERAVTSGDTTLRYHFNFDASHAATDEFTISLAFFDLDDNGLGTGVFNGTFAVNGVAMGSFAHTTATLNQTFTSDSFTLGDVNGTAGAPDDNYVEIVTSAATGARWSNMNYIRMDVEPVPEPSGTMLAVLGAIGLIARRRRR